MGTEAVPRDIVRSDGHERPQCPSCPTGRMHPFRIDIHLGGFHGYRYGIAWVLACRPPDTDEHPDARTGFLTCGFTVPFTPFKAQDYLTEMPTSAMPRLET